MLVLADSIKCSVHERNLDEMRGIWPKCFFHHHPTNSTNLAWLKVDTPKNSTWTSKITQREIQHTWNSTIKDSPYPVPGCSRYFPSGVRNKLQPPLLTQDLFVPLRLEGSPRERQLIEVGFEWDDCVSPLRVEVAAPNSTCWKSLKPCSLLVKHVDQWWGEIQKS